MNCVTCCISKKKKLEGDITMNSDKYKSLILPPTPPTKMKNNLINIKNDIKINKDKGL